jgi:predicted SAM-dependent methyltransferase
MKIFNYSNYRSFKNWNAESFGEINSNDRVYFNNEFDRIGITEFDSKKILELGFGNGSFASWAVQKDFNYVGVELISDLVKVAKERGFNVFDSLSPLEKIVASQSIDYVVAFDVFEHLNIKEIELKLIECFAILKSGGKLIGRVPSGDSPFSLSIQNGDMTHKSSLGSSMIRQLAMAIGFEVEVIRSPSLPIMGLGIKTLFRRLIIRIVRRLSYPFVINIFMGGGKLVLTPNLLFVLKKP